MCKKKAIKVLVGFILMLGSKIIKKIKELKLFILFTKLY